LLEKAAAQERMSCDLIGCFDRCRMIGTIILPWTFLTCPISKWEGPLSSDNEQLIARWAGHEIRELRRKEVQPARPMQSTIRGGVCYKNLAGKYLSVQNSKVEERKR
jgi:hypothetical protein